MKTVECRGCGKQIIFATDAKGTLHPLDPSAPVFKVSIDLDTDQAVCEPVSRAGSERVMVSHFATCADATKCSRKGRT